MNKAVGGINPVAVEAMALSRVGRGPVVYMPTVDAAALVPNSPNAAAVSRNEQLLPGTLEVIKVILEVRSRPVHRARQYRGGADGNSGGKDGRGQQDLRAAPESRGIVMSMAQMKEAVGVVRKN